ncbi:Plant self-incompatibility protein S1 family [Striga hermonthica]|uniref:S-protein homolog n=1 Tax=Striga hermonthica TaxID=68872 RepID=A0A9N7N625_STRHE|nr:Plant self-incompatibility protein S1 family [Striga hermonthica]
MFRTTNIVYLALFLLLSTNLSHKGKSCFLLYDARVSFTNNLPQNSKPLNLHCASKNDDLGNHTVGYGESWGFKFCVNPFATLFYCDLNWGDKSMSVHAFDGKWYISAHDPCAGNRGNNCAWKVDSDGAKLPKGEVHHWE